eukprot:2172643-Heterocapsa_arctica.AAC.1
MCAVRSLHTQRNHAACVRNGWMYSGPLARPRISKPNLARDTQPKQMSTGLAGHLLLNAFGTLEGRRAKPPAAS